MGAPRRPRRNGEDDPFGEDDRRDTNARCLAKRRNAACGVRTKDLPTWHRFIEWLNVEAELDSFDSQFHWCLSAAQVSVPAVTCLGPSE